MRHKQKLRLRRCAAVLLCLGIIALHAPGQQAVSRSGPRLIAGGKPFYFLGANGYYLLDRAAHGDSSAVDRVFTLAASLGLNVIRTWAFFDSPDTLNPAVIQSAPGRFNEHALRALDLVIAMAKRRGIYLLLPFVNGWDDFGGMNQYVRWRAAIASGGAAAAMRPGDTVQPAVVRAPGGRSYAVYPAGAFTHDAFYADPQIRRWFMEYMAALARRVNTVTGVRYADEPAIFGWELANEPRSSDVSGMLVTAWAKEMSAFLKSIDTAHLVGTGEEGFDTGGNGYSVGSFPGHEWMFNGLAGLSFSANIAIPTIDLAGIHLYSAQWDLPSSAGNTWIRDHLSVAAAAGKPMIIGEFATPLLQPATYDSWLTTALLDGAAGALVWHLSQFPDEYSIWCPGNERLCAVLRDQAGKFSQKSDSGLFAPPVRAQLFQAYPNPSATGATIMYALPYDAFVTLEIYNILGEEIRLLVSGFQHAGVRKELLDGPGFPSGAYFYRLDARPAVPGAGRAIMETGKLLIVR